MNRDSQVYLPLYIVILVSAVTYFTYSMVKENYPELLLFATANPFLVLAIPLSFTASLVWHFKMIRVYVFRMGQGRKLSDLNQKVKTTKSKDVFRAYIRSLIITAVSCIPLFMVHVAKFYLVTGISLLDFKLMLYGTNVLFLTSALTTIQIYYLKSNTGKKRAVNIKKMPSINKRQVVLGSVGEDHDSIDEKEVVKPFWLYLAAKGLVGGIAILGGIGKGKTSSIIIPLLIQVLRIYKKSTIYIGDTKGTLIGHITEVLENSNREVIRFCYGSKLRFNPIYRKDQLQNGNYERLASVIKYASKNVLGSDPKSKFWDKKAYDLVIMGIVSCHLSYDYYTINDLRAEIVTINPEKLEALESKLESGIFNTEETHNIKMGLMSIREYIAMGDELKSSILASATVFLDLFNDYQVASIFCPSKSEVNLNSFDELVGANKIILTYFDSLELSRGLGTFLKILFTNASKRHFLSNRDKDRRYFLFADEFQEIATESDTDITALGREFGIIHIISCQGLSQLISRLGRESLAQELMNNFLNKICFQVTDMNTIRYFTSIAGKYEDTRISEGFSENTQRADKSWIDGGYTSDAMNVHQSYSSMTEQRYYLSEEDFTRLRAYEALSFVTDGVNSRFYKLFTRPYYLPSRLPYKKILETICEEESCLLPA